MFQPTMANQHRRTFLKTAGAVGVAGLAGCVNGGEGSQNTGTQIGMVYATGGLGDKSFNDMAHKGVEKAKNDLDISYQESQPDAAADFQSAQRDFAESGDYGLICCIGYAQTDALKTNAPQYPEQKFMLVDSVVDEKNVSNYVFKEHEGSFQVGHLAGLLTSQQFEAGAGSTNPDAATVGFVGGVEAPLIKKFEAGFKVGVKYANEDANVVSSYVGSFNDTAGGKEAAVSMYDGEDADIVYHAAGATGVGVFQAAQEKGRFAIGVDADQSKSEPDFANVILASMVKRVDTAVYNAVKRVVNDNFKGGGKPQTLGLEQDGVRAVYGSELGSEIPEDVKSKLTKSREKIIQGDISVPESPQ